MAFEEKNKGKTPPSKAVFLAWEEWVVRLPDGRGDQRRRHLQFYNGFAAAILSVSIGGGLLTVLYFAIHLPRLPVILSAVANLVILVLLVDRARFMGRRVSDFELTLVIRELNDPMHGSALLSVVSELSSKMDSGSRWNISKTDKRTGKRHRRAAQNSPLSHS